MTTRTIIQEAEQQYLRETLARLKTDFDDAKECVGKGWHPLIDCLYAFARPLFIDHGFVVNIEQVKEKFATLRFYYFIEHDFDKHPSLYRKSDDGQMIAYGWRRYRFDDDEKEEFKAGVYADFITLDPAETVLRTEKAKFYGAVEYAGVISGSICEDCGAFGKRENTKGWFKTLCGSCLEKRNNRN